MHLKTFLAFLFALLVTTTGHAQANRDADIYTGEFESTPKVDPHFQLKIQEAAREQQEQYRPRIQISDAVGDKVTSLTVARRAIRQNAVRAAAQNSQITREDLAIWLPIFASVVLLGGLFVRKYAPDLLKAINTGLNPWVAGDAASRLSTKVRAEEESLSEFLAALRSGPLGVGDGALGGAGAGDLTARAEAIKTFYEKVPAKIETQRRMVQEIHRTTDEGGRQKMLTALRWEMHAIRGEAGVPELQPVWQLAFAVEGLLKQLTDNANNVTASCLRTLEGGLELLEEISRPGVEPDLLTRQALRLLAADDDPISRKAVSFALKRALNEPELAADGEAALALATANAYDVIFLDVQMPKMDGFELCTRIHKTDQNRNTPVVFVTCHSDFEARAKSTLSGGSDLIGKPFLTFEITVKALTLALRGRLAALAEAVKAVEKSPAATTESTDHAVSSLAFAGWSEVVESESEAEEVATQFLSRAWDHLAPLRNAFKALLATSDEAMRQDLLGDIFLRVHSFLPKNGLPAGHPAVQLSAGIESLLRKLLEQPGNASGSTLFTLATGVQVLDDLCTLGAEPGLMTHPPIRMLVVDDDPVSRRAVSLALQMMFDKPESAEGGEAALELATKRPYDVIFMDVQMPGMDGFEACSKIRQTKANGSTPVVFVTGHSDFKARVRMSASGASDFVGKPFLKSELTLKALSFALRGRMGRRRAQPIEPAPMLTTAHCD